MEHHIEIKKIITGGAGLGYLKDGMVAMVPYVLPEEQVHIREAKRLRNHIEGELLSVTTPSPDRQTPPCPYYTLCGGCNLQHTSYSRQLHIKQGILEENLGRAGIDLTSLTVHPPLASPETLGYRKKIRLHCNSEGQLGYHRPGTNQIVAIDRCLLASREINRTLDLLLNLAGFSQVVRESKSIEFIEHPEEHTVTLILDRQTPLSEDQTRLLGKAAQNICRKSSPKNKPHKKDLVTQEQIFYLKNFHYTLRWDQNCFFQMNTVQNNQLVTLVTKLLEKTGTSLLDLYCGMGNFSLPAALTGKNVHGIEHNRQSIRWAQKNRDENGQDLECHFTNQDVGRFLQTGAHTDMDVILLDPPRQGLGKKNAHLLAQTRAQDILYISCDPATFCRDLSTFHSNGFSCRHIFPVDMFPQTHHIESVALLEKN